MSDTQLDRDIEAAVGIEPSPEFLARVRTRIAADPALAVESGFSRIRRLSFEPLAAVAIVGIVLAVVVSQFTRDETARPQVVQSSVGDVPAAAAVPGTASQPAVARSQTAVGRPRPSRPVVERAESPRTLPLQLSPVLFAEEDRLAFARFVTAVSDGTVPEEVVQALREEEMTPLGIALLVIDPLPPLARVERQGEGQW